MNYKNSLLSGFIVILIAAFVLMGCEKKKETPENQTQTTPADTMTKQTPPATDTTVQKPQEAQLVGTWEGKFGARKMTLNITSQDGNKLEGETVVRWDHPKKEKVTGEFNSDTRELKIKETAGSRNNGNYTGTVSADMKTFTGVWKDNGNRLSYNITLNKK